MRINFFSIILILLMITSFGKVLFLFDRMMINYAQLETNASTIFSIASANAGANSKKKTDVHTEQVTLEKTVTEAKSEKRDLVDNPQPGNVPPKKVNNIGMDNLLDTGFTGDEVKLLKELSRRRQELDRYHQQLILKESLLKSTDEKIEKKISELKQMEVRISDLMLQLEDKSNVRIKSLAKIYENMKSQDAAKIFDELDMPILLEIIRNMKEPKVGPIIAQMNPSKAKEVSLEFAKISDRIESIKK
jgi:flagellar motility protein MotE (MotC chaperone)